MEHYSVKMALNSHIRKREQLELQKYDEIMKDLLRTLCFLIFLIPSSSAQSKWVNLKHPHLNEVTVAAWASAVNAGFYSALIEQSTSHPNWAESIFGVRPHSFWGSEQWTLDYTPSGKHRIEILGNFGYDAHHTIGDIKNVSTFSMGVLVPFSSIDWGSINKKQIIRKTIINGVSAWLMRGLTESITYSVIEHYR